MMHIHLQNLGKQFGSEWLFRQLNLELSTGQAYAITGPNGSGKSTLLKIIAGALPPTTGSLTYQRPPARLPAEAVFRYMAIAAPYLELIEELSLKECIDFQSKFKKFQIAPEQIIERIGLKKSLHKPVKYFSSGMKQKLKLALAFYSDAEVLILDEPTSNLDAANIGWYQQEVALCLSNRLVIVGSNQHYEYNFCSQVIELSQFKY